MSEAFEEKSTELKASLCETSEKTRKSCDECAGICRDPAVHAAICQTRSSH